MIHRSKRTIARTVAALGAIGVLAVILCVGSAIAGSIYAISQYGYELLPQRVPPSNCRNPDRLCLWEKESDSSLYLHRVDGRDVGLSPTDVFNIRDYGATGDGTSDDTLAIDTACRDARNGGTVIFPVGRYRYSGSGCTGPAMKFAGAGKDSSVVLLADHKYFVDDNERWNSFQMRGLRFEGGAGVIRNRFSGTDVANYKEVDDCYFKDFTSAAISSNSSDDPYWKITRSIFFGANTTTSVGVALSGLSDGDTIRDCEFLLYKVGVKLAHGGNNAHITDSSFLQFQEGSSRAAIWIVPQRGNVNAGQGLVISNIKFGNENLAQSDYRILYADEAAGRYFGDRLWANTASSGWISGHRVHSVLVNGSGSHMQPVVYSYTSNIEGSEYGPITVGGTPPSFIVELSAPPRDDISVRGGNILGPVSLANAHVPSGLGGWRASNAPAMFAVLDPAAVFTAADPTLMDAWTPGTGPAGYSNLLITEAAASYGRSGGVTAVRIRDAAGEMDAFDYNIPRRGLIATALSGTVVAGEPIWIEVDVRQGNRDSLSNVQVRIQELENDNIWWRRSIAVPNSGWRRYRFAYVPSSIPRNGFRVSFANTEQTSGSVALGRVRVYRAFEPISGGQLDGLWNSGVSSFRGPATFAATLTGVGDGGVDWSGMRGSYDTPQGKATFHGSANLFVSQLQFGSPRQAYSGTLTARHGRDGDAGDVVLWNIGLASGEPKVTFRIRVSVNRVGSAVCAIRELNFSAVGGKSPNQVAALSSATDSLVFGRAAANEFSPRLEIVRNRLLVKLSSSKSPFNYVATGVWEAPDIGDGGEIVRENGMDR